MNLLFLCSYGQVRSKAAAKIFGGRYAGTDSMEYPDGDLQDLIDWADVVFCMTTHHYNIVEEWLGGKPCFVLSIRDMYGSEDAPELVRILKRRVPRYLELVK